MIQTHDHQSDRQAYWPLDHHEHYPAPNTQPKIRTMVLTSENVIK